MSQTVIRNSEIHGFAIGQINTIHRIKTYFFWF